MFNVDVNVDSFSEYSPPAHCQRCLNENTQNTTRLYSTTNTMIYLGICSNHLEARAATGIKITLIRSCVRTNYCGLHTDIHSRPRLATPVLTVGRPLQPQTFKGRINPRLLVHLCSNKPVQHHHQRANQSWITTFQPKPIWQTQKVSQWTYRQTCIVILDPLLKESIG